MTILDDITDALVAANLGQITNDAADWMIFKGYLQEAPDRAICVYTAGGRPPETGQPVDYPNFQIRVRGAADDYQATADKEQAIFNFLHAGDAPVQLGAAYVYCYAIQSGPIPLGQDQNRRPALVRNYRIMKVRSS